MGLPGCFMGLIAAMFAVIAVLPFLGWLNWITTLPAAGLAILFCAPAYQNDRSNKSELAGLVAGVLVFAWAITRLGIGGGLI